MASRKENDPGNGNSQMRNYCCRILFNRQVVLSFLLWLSVVVLGFGYVAICLCQRTQPFRSGNNPFQDFVLLLGICGALFWFGPVRNFQWKFEQPIQLVAFVVPFFAALHWAFLGRAIGAHFSLTPSGLSSLDLPSLIALIVAAICIGFVFVYHLLESIRGKIVLRYFASLAIPVIGIAALTMVMAETRYLHFHHYCVGLLLFPFCRFRSAFSLGCQAFFLGLAVEGVARWGFDPVWCLVVK